MAIILLTSVSLFALLVTTYPIHSDVDAGLSELTPISSTVQTAFHVHLGEDAVRLDATRFHSQNSKQQIEHISEPNAKDITAPSSEISPRVKPSFQVFLDEPASENNEFGTNNGLDGSLTGQVAHEHAATGLAVDEQRVFPVLGLPATPLMVLAFSCMASFLVVAYIALTLYIIKSLRAQILTSKTAWELLPRFWGDASATTKKDFLGRSCHRLLQTDIGQQRLVHAEEGSAEMHGFHTEDKPLDAVSDTQSELDDVDEKYQDALDMTPLPITHDLPLEEHASHQSRFDDPPLLSLGSYPLDQQTDDHSPRMHGSGSSPATRPTWSLRAVDNNPPLGLSSNKFGDVDSTLQPLIHPRRRAYRSAVPEFDVAFAMQLRPGIGIGADSAWMVRFLMTIFGWFAVALTNNTQ